MRRSFPDLRAAAATGQPEAIISTAVAAIQQEWAVAVIVGHSGAGSIIPSIAAELGRRRTRMVFVDARIPPCEVEVVPPGSAEG